jgi:hypothetical protein
MMNLERKLKLFNWLGGSVYKHMLEAQQMSIERYAEPSDVKCRRYPGAPSLRTLLEPQNSQA